MREGVEMSVGRLLVLVVALAAFIGIVFASVAAEVAAGPEPIGADAEGTVYIDPTDRTSGGE